LPFLSRCRSCRAAVPVALPFLSRCRSCRARSCRAAGDGRAPPRCRGRRATEDANSTNANGAARRAPCATARAVVAIFGTVDDAIAAELTQGAVRVAAAVAPDIVLFALIALFAEAEDTVAANGAALARRRLE